jgi:hypothetical protein
MKTRDIKELLILLRNYIKTEYDFMGMCGSTSEMRSNGIINYAEEQLIGGWNNDNKPDDANPFGFWWTPGETQPRLDWLNEQIAKL